MLFPVNGFFLAWTNKVIFVNETAPKVKYLNLNGQATDEEVHYQQESKRKRLDQTES